MIVSARARTHTTRRGARRENWSVSAVSLSCGTSTMSTSSEKILATGQQKCHIHSMENVTLTPKEQTRLQVLNSLLVEHMTLDQAATLMGVSPRHTRRILADYRKNGAASLAHGHRGRKPANAIPEATRSRVVHLARTVYEGANHTHLSELLSERVGLDMGRTTLRRILVNAGLSSPRRRRPPKHRVRRQRMPREGMLIQMDGSYHRWLGEDGPQFTILFAVDDATGCVVNALFCDHDVRRQLLLPIPSIILAGSPPFSDHAAGPLRCGSWGRRIPG